VSSVAEGADGSIFKMVPQRAALCIGSSGRNFRAWRIAP
jgi:hypothetical protein